MTTTLSTGHQAVVDAQSLTLTISGPSETMDSIPDGELAAAARAEGCEIDWAAGPVDERTYRLVSHRGADLGDGEPDRLAESLQAAAAALDEERRQPIQPPPGYFES